MHQQILPVLCAALKGCCTVASSPGSRCLEPHNISRAGGPHLAHGHCRVVVAQWTTRDFGTPVVQWGLQSGVVQQQGNGSYSTYTRLQMCGAPASAQGAVFVMLPSEHGTEVGCHTLQSQIQSQSSSLSTSSWALLCFQVGWTRGPSTLRP